jgi:hypothetical protein
MDPSRPLRPAILIALSLLGCAAAALSRVIITNTIRVDEVEWVGAVVWASLPLRAFHGLFAVCAAYYFLRAERAPCEVPLRRLFAGAVLIHLFAALALPHTSNDAFSNVAYGHMWRLGLNPYFAGPSALGPHDAFAQMVGLRWIDTPSVYGPVLNWVNALAGLADTVEGALAIFKIEMLATSLAIALTAWGFCRSRRAGREATAAFVLVAWNPLVAWEVAGQSHNDGVMALAMVAFVWAAVAEREWIALASIATAFYVKFAVAPVMALYLVHVWRRDRLRALAMAAVVLALGAALFGPYWGGRSTLSSPLAAAGGGADRVTHSFAALIGQITYRLHAPRTWKVLYKVWWALGNVLLGWTFLRGLLRARTVQNVLEDSLVFLLYYDLLAAPWFHPWYLTWILPLAMGLEDAGWRRVVAVYSALAVVQYAFPLEPVNDCVLDVIVLRMVHRRLGEDSFLYVPGRLFRALRDAQGPWARRAKSLAPWLVAAGALAWLVHLVPVRALLSALERVAPGRYVALVAGFVLSCLVADAFALSVTFRRALPGVRVKPLEVVIIRALAYLPGLLHNGLGQGGVAWLLHRRRGVPLGDAAGAMVLAMGGNVIMVSTCAAAALLLGFAPEAGLFRSMLLGLGATLVVYLALIATRPRWLVGRPVLKPLFDAGIGGHLLVAAARLPHFGVQIGFHWLAMRAFGVATPLAQAAMRLPIMFVIGSVPVTPAGLGTAQAAALALFSPFAGGVGEAERQAAVLAYSLSIETLSTIGSCLLGLGFLAGARARGR